MYWALRFIWLILWALGRIPEIKIAGERYQVLPLHLPFEDCVTGHKLMRRARRVPNAVLCPQLGRWMVTHGAIPSYIKDTMFLFETRDYDEEWDEIYRVVFTKKKWKVFGETPNHVYGPKNRILRRIPSQPQ